MSTADALWSAGESASRSADHWRGLPSHLILSQMLTGATDMQHLQESALKVWALDLEAAALRREALAAG